MRQQAKHRLEVSSARQRSLIASLGALLTFGLVVGFAPMSEIAQGATPEVGSQARATDDGAFSETKTVTRSFFSGATETVVDSRDVTVTVDKTNELQGRERLNVSWSGAHPSGGRATSPFGDLGMQQEYPMVILQCRGVDDASAPAEDQISPETCFTQTRVQRSQSASARAAVWTHDKYATAEERAQKYAGSLGLPIPDICNDAGSLVTHLTPFRRADGTTDAACTSDTMPPEAAAGSSFPAAEQAAFTDLNGNGSTLFEVRSDIEKASLGCNHDTNCTLVVIPIMGISCADADRECKRTGKFLPGSSNFTGDGVDLAVSPLLWWSASNWRNRISVPLHFALPPNTCDVLDPRAPTGLYGSELMAQAALQWTPAYCLRKDRFKLEINRMSDEAGFNLMTSGGAVGALVSGEYENRGTDPIGYAPTALTGFGIGYIIDKPDNEGQYTSLKLNARLLAKLLTQSYTASSIGAGHPGMADNPTSINKDPEFMALNPDLDQTAREAAATVLSLSEGSGVMEALSSYIQADPDARAFISGEADPWGMVVNPNYKDIALPVRVWPLLDDFIPTSSQKCRQENPAVYLSQVAAPVTTLRKIAEAVLDAWPNVQTRCDGIGPPVEPWKLGRIDRQGVGARFLLGIVSLGDAARYGLQVASLQTSSDNFVAPASASMLAAVATAKPGGDDLPWILDQETLRKSATAYPGTMLVYTAARLEGMDQASARKVHDFLTISSTEGQVPGRGNGDLAAGFVPLTKTGPTSKLWAQTQRVAAEVLKQDQSTPTPTPTDTATTSATPEPTVDPVGPVDTPSTEVPTASSSPSSSSPPTYPVIETQSVSSSWSSATMPVLVIAGLLAAFVGLLLRLLLTVRRYL